MAVLSEWPFQNPEIASRPDADQKITFYPPEREKRDGQKFKFRRCQHANIQRANVMYEYFIILYSILRVCEYCTVL